ncbi:MAG: hypothetical protein AB7T59_16595 [Hyphomonadaceae bacterium]
MKNLLMSAMALTAVLVIPSVASADQVADRTRAIELCRAEVTAQAGEGATVRFDQVRVRPRAVRVEFDVWRNHRLQNVRCDVTRAPALAIAAITPTLQTASAASIAQ